MGLNNQAYIIFPELQPYLSLWLIFVPFVRLIHTNHLTKLVDFCFPILSMGGNTSALGTNLKNGSFLPITDSDTVSYPCIFVIHLKFQCNNLFQIVHCEPGFYW